MVGPGAKAARIQGLKHYFREKLAHLPFARIKTPGADTLSAGITTVELAGLEVRPLAKILAEKYAIDCRPMTTHGLNGLRISLSVFNTEADVDYLALALKEVHQSQKS